MDDPCQKRTKYGELKYDDFEQVAKTFLFTIHHKILIYIEMVHICLLSYLSTNPLYR